MGIEITVSITTDHDDPVRAYQQIIDLMMSQDLNWVSSEYWYDSEGDEVLTEDMAAARAAAKWECITHTKGV